MASKRFRDAVGIDPDRVVAAALDAALGETPSRDKKKHHPGRILVAGAAVAAAAAVGQRRMPKLAKVPLRMGLHKLGDMAHVGDLADAVRDRLSGHEEPPEEDDYYDEEFDDEEDLEDEDFDDEPRDESDEPPDDEDLDDEDEDDEDFDDEPEDDDGPRGEGDEVEEEPEDEEPDEEEPEAVEDDEDLEPEDDEDLEPEDDEDLEPEDDEDLEPEEGEDEDEEIAARSLDLGLPAESSDRRTRGHVPDLFEALRTPHRRAPVIRRGSLRVDPATRPPQPDEKPREGRRDRAKKPKAKAARA